MEVFAHRGASATHPENTLSAFQQALDCGADGIELDIQLAEKQVLVFHDRWLNRTTNGEGRFDQQSVHYLQHLDAGNGEHIPSLLEVLTMINGRCKVNVEFKHPTVALPGMELLEWAMSELDFQPEQFIISAFNHSILEQLNSSHPEWSLAMLTASLPINIVPYCQQLGCRAIHIDIDSLEPELVAAAHDNGLAVRVYTVDQPDDWLQLQQYGVDGIFTNTPEQAKRVLAGKEPHQ